MVRVLTLPVDNFDDSALFTAEITDFRGNKNSINCYLFDYKEENIVYIMKKADCIKSHYSEKDRETSARLRAMVPLKNGDVVEYNGNRYHVKILGNYSDAGRLIPV